MTATVPDLYAAYARLEDLPARAAAEAAAAAKATADARREAAATRARLEKTNREQSAAVTAKYQRAAAQLDSRLGALVRSAQDKGVLPRATGSPARREPKFEEVKRQDAALENLLADRRRLESELAALHEQLARENDAQRARRNDTITLTIGLVGLVVVAAAGANALGVAVAIGIALVIQYRLGRVPSAFLPRRIARTPGLAHDRRRRSGLTRMLGGCFIVASLAVALAASVVVGLLAPAPVRQFFDALSALAPLARTYAQIVLALGGVYGVFLVIHGALRFRGR